MKNYVINWASKMGLIESGDTIVCAVSGGVDSMVLLEILSSMQSKLGIFVVAAHFNHNIRGEESYRDEYFVREYCADNNITLHVGSGDVLGRAAVQHESVEEAARVLRYQFLESVADKYSNAAKTAKIATAHHANDNLETVIMNMLRGSSTGGLAGIPISRGNIIRPLLACTRSEIEGYAESNGIGYVTDSTNHCDDYLRNRVRHLIIPMLQRENPDIVHTMVKTTDSVREDTKYLNRKANEVVNNATIDDGQYNIRCFSVERPIKSRAIYQILMKFGIEASFSHIESVLECIESKKQVYRVSLPNGIVAVKNGNILRICKTNNDRECLREFQINSIGKTVSDDGRFLVKAHVIDAVTNIPKDPNKIVVKADSINWPLIIRGRHDGDKIKTAAGTSPVGRYLRSKGVDEFSRSSYPLICDDNGIVGIPGFTIDMSRKVDIGDKAIVLEVFWDR